MSTGWTVNRLKRPRPEDDSDDDHMDVDSPADVVTVETKIKPSNKGFEILTKMGWKEGQSLGLSGEGRVDPIPFQLKVDSVGLGKFNQDFRIIEDTVGQRRELDSERQQRETEEQRRAREEANERRSAVENEVTDILKPFYCSLCDKQFKNVIQYDEHTNSYAHHHKARFNHMQANVRVQPQEEIDRRKEKERRREEKELRKIAAANGVKMPKPRPVAAVDPPVEQPAPEAAPAPLPSPPPPDLIAPPDPMPPSLDVVAQAGRKGWQQFQMSNSKRIAR